MSLYLCVCKWYRQFWSAESSSALWPWQICVIMSKREPQGQLVLHSSQYTLPIKAFIKHSLAQQVSRKSDGISLKLCFHRRRHTWWTKMAVFSPPSCSACRPVRGRPGTASDQNRLWVYVTNVGNRMMKEQKSSQVSTSDIAEVKPGFMSPIFSLSTYHNFPHILIEITILEQELKKEATFQ